MSTVRSYHFYRSPCHFDRREKSYNTLISHKIVLLTLCVAQCCCPRLRRHQVQILQTLSFTIARCLPLQENIKKDPGSFDAGSFLSHHILRYLSSDRMRDGAWFAWASIAVPACIRICCLVKFVISDAISTSRMAESTAWLF